MLWIADEVRGALARRKPVVALESTLFAHGLPAPRGVATARALEAIVRGAGATPATVGMIEGRLIVGLADAEIVRIADGPATRKLSRSDLAHAAATRATGATTVSATMIAAHRAGIPLFATGGIGGVHRGVEQTMDVSADLTELGRTPVCVVAAGAKSILDLPRTLELLETHGVPVIGYATDELPAFFVRSSGLSLHQRVEDAEEAARVIRAQQQLGLETGILLARGLSAAFGIDVKLKWPNDLLVDRRKLGGLLIEARSNDDGEGWAVIGLGLNVRGTRAELDARGLSGATSLEACGAAPALLEGETPLDEVLAILDEGVGEPSADPLPEAFAAVSG